MFVEFTAKEGFHVEKDYQRHLGPSLRFSLFTERIYSHVVSVTIM